MGRFWTKRYTSVSWGDIRPSDLDPQGEPEIKRDCRGMVGQPERDIALLIKGEYVPVLGLLAIRCTRRGDEIGTPISMAIADHPMPVSHADGDDGA